MRYLDASDRTDDNALGKWLVKEVSNNAATIRWQSGYFTSEPLGLIEDPLNALAARGGLVRAVVGSNDGATTAQSLRDLCSVLDLPQDNAAAGVVKLQNALFHPKTFHISRSDGSQAAYVGSANLTGSGAALHIEAGLTIDTREGDNEAVATQIADAVDSWFGSHRDGFYPVSEAADVQGLIDRGIVDRSTEVKRPRAKPSSHDGEAGASMTRLITIPRLQRRGAIATPPPRVITGVSLADYPANLLFAPGSVGPVVGAAAVSPIPLPEDSSGLVVRLTRDSTKRLDDRPGTSYMSLPSEVLDHIIFGIGGNNLPRAEFDFVARFWADSGEALRSRPATTNITQQE